MAQQGASLDTRTEEDFVFLGKGRMFMAYVSAAFGFSAMVMAGFLVPLRAKELGAPLEVIGLVVGFSGLLPAFLSISAGALIDRHGPRKAYLWSSVLSALVALLSALTSNYWVLGLLQIGAGLFSSMAWLASQAYVTSLGRSDELPGILGRMSFSTNAGMVISPVLIGFSADMIGYQWSFGTMAVIAAVFALIGWLLPPVRLRAKGKAGSAFGITTAARLLRLRGMQAVLILTLVRVGSVTGWMSFFPLLLVEHGFSKSMAGSAISVHALLATFLTLSAGRVAAWMGSVMAITLALGIGAVGIALSPVMADPWLFWIPALLVGVGQGISLPLLIATVSEEAPPEQRGVALGMRQMANQFGVTFAPIGLGAIAASAGLLAGFVATAGVSIGLLALGYWMHSTVRRA